MKINSIEKCDCFSLLKTIKSDYVDMIFTDPPYWTLNKWRNVGTTTRLGGSRDKSKQTGWFDTIDSPQLFGIMKEFYRVLKKDKHCFIMCDGQTLKYILDYSDKVGFNYCKPLVWNKILAGMGYHFRCQHEFVVMLDKGKNLIPKDRSQTDVINIKMVRGGYPTEKPVELPELFIKNFTDEGDVVLDPFCGSGSTILAAIDLNRNYISCDISDKAIDYANNRIKCCKC